MTRRIALATCARLPALTPDDRLLAAALERRGATPCARVWDDAGVPWREHDGVVIRSCWDYHLRLAEFTAWLDRLERSRVRVWNPPALLRWNANKRYLRELEEEGVPVVPTAWLESRSSIGALLRERGWNRAVVKPAVSASAHGTWRTDVDRAAADQARLDEAMAAGALLVQPFLEEVARDGEWSLLFFGGTFSHAVCKRPREGEFRVQHEFGGTAHQVRAPGALRRDAERVLAAACRRLWIEKRDVAYARVDGVERDGRLLLMELECIEPQLYLALEPTAPERLAAVLLRDR